MGKHQKEEKKNKKIGVIFIVILLIVGISAGAYYFINNSDKSLEISSQLNKKIEEIKNDNKDTENTVEEPEIEIPDKMSNYKVLGVLKIDKIGLEKNILDSTTDDALNVSITKFYGPKINEVGNFCITGHNYKNAFAKLPELEIKDTFCVIDQENSQKVTYEIYDIYTVYPKELDCLSQETNGKREVTLITCNPGGVTRLIIKAREI